MNQYLASYLKNGNLFETEVQANTNYKAREKVAIRFNIPIKFEIGTPYMNEDNHVSAVVKVNV